MFTLLAPPSFPDAETDRKAQVVHKLLWGAMAIITLLTIVDVIAIPGNFSRWIFIITVFDGGSLCLLLLNKHGYARTSAILFVIFTLVLIFGLASTAGGIKAVTIQFFPLPVVIAGLVLGWEAGLAAGVAAIIAAFVLALMEYYGWLPATAVTHDVLTLWVTSAASICVLMLLQYLSVAGLNKALREAQRDLQLRQKVEDELRKTEAFRKRIFDSSRIPIVVMDAEHSTFIDCNQAAVEFYGYASKEETLGRTPIEVSPPTQEDGTPSAEKAHMYIAQVLSSGFAIFEWLHLRTDGELLNTEVHLMSFEAEGHTYLQFTLIDIKDRKQAETALRTSESKYRELWEATVEGIVIHDQGVVVEVNDAMCRMFGMAREQVIGRSLLDFTTPEARGRLRDHIMSGVVGNYETPAMHADGTKLTLEIFAKQIQFYNKSARMVAIRDVTEQRRLEAQFRQTQRLESLGTLAGGIAHDLNNVLTPIMMSLALLNQKVTDPVLKKHIASIESSAHRGSDIVGQVLLFARGSEKEYAPQQLERIIGEITSIIKQTFPRNIEIVTDIGRDLYSIRGDATQLHQVLMNLCVNARDAMPAGGRLAITALNRFVSAADATLQFGGPPGDYVGLKISDTGTGMPKVIQERIFEPFFTTKEIGKGTGLGLSTVYAIVKNHKGFISLTSEEGEGTCFSVFIPAGQQSSDIRPATVEAAPQGGCGETILVVDDEEAVLEITREILELSGYTVLTARNGAEALSIFVAAGEGSIKLVVTDVNMPGMDGPTVVETIRKLMPSVKAIIVSGLISDWEPAKKTGVQIEGYLMKPYTSERLLAMIHEVLTRKSA